jgi:putative FmdB family regulatory protein
VPTYDYQCRSCGVITEVVHSMLEDGPTKCERCGGQLRRVFHPTGIIFKGGGFYKTDSRSSTTASVPGGEKAASQPSSDGAASKTAGTGSGSGDKGAAPAPSAGDAGKGSSGSD